MRGGSGSRKAPGELLKRTANGRSEVVENGSDGRADGFDRLASCYRAASATTYRTIASAKRGSEQGHPGKEPASMGTGRKRGSEVWRLAQSTFCPATGR